MRASIVFGRYAASRVYLVTGEHGMVGTVYAAPKHMEDKRAAVRWPDGSFSIHEPAELHEIEVPEVVVAGMLAPAQYGGCK